MFLSKILINILLEEGGDGDEMYITLDYDEQGVIDVLYSIGETSFPPFKKKSKNV